MNLRKGIKLLEDRVGDGLLLQRQHSYVIALRFSLNQGQILPAECAALSYSLDNNLEWRADGFFVHRTYLHRENLIAGLFYALDGMRIGGFRKVRIAPHLAFGEKGLPGKGIPPNALLIAEIEVIEELESLKKHVDDLQQREQLIYGSIPREQAVATKNGV